MSDVAKFKTEAELCAAFIAAATADGKWIAYNETAGFDILMVRVADGAQIGIEAKLALNPKVISQALPDYTHAEFGPDYRAVLIPTYAPDALSVICARLGLTVLRFGGDDKKRRYGWETAFAPELPAPGDRTRDTYYWHTSYWHEWMPPKRCTLPEYVPDCAAGAPAPQQLTPWKIGAIKICILLEERPVTRADFKHIGINPSRWTAPWPGWLSPSTYGYVAGKNLPDFKAQHPRNYEEIKADKAKWAPKLQGLI